MGETISECLGLYYQGPDRTWRWTCDDVGAWATGAKPFCNLRGAMVKVGEAIGDGMLTGDRLFKFRIVDEEMVRDRIEDTLGAERGPTLVFGHTHEMRLDAARLISWSRVPPPNGPVERRVWSAVEAEGVWSAQASRVAVPL